MRPQVLTKLACLRKEAAAAIDRLIAFRDATDDYTMDELEETGDEHERSLAACERHPSAYGAACRSSIGDQTNWMEGNSDDGEQDDAESGIADFEGLLEQIGSGDWTHTVMG